MDSKTETVSDNAMIAEFMGYKFQCDRFTRPQGQYTNADGHGLFLEDLKYHTSWDWLMLVVRKIYSIYIEFDFQSIKDENIFLDALENPVKYPISDTYRKVVECVKFINSQSPDTIK